MKNLVHLLVMLMLAPALLASDAGPQTLDQLLDTVRQRQSQEKALYQEREQRFLADRQRQQQLVDEAKARFIALQKTNNPLQQQADDNERQLQAMREELQQHITDLGDIYSIYNEFAGDFIARLRDSLVHSQLAGREAQLAAIEARDSLPQVQQMRELWLLVQQEMTEAGKISRYQADVVQADGSSRPQTLWRIGSFSLVGEQGLLQYLPASGELLALPRQPAGIGRAAGNFYRGEGDPLPLLIDPTRGELLGLLGQSPDLSERIRQGREVGYAIIAIGIAGLLLALYRMLYLGIIWLKTRRQLAGIATPQGNNPLGRVLQQAATLPAGADEKTLQSRLDESILKEMPALEQGQGLIKLLAAIAPLLGLLGTVIGMIATFQSISLFGSGDPKLMASGISQALVTTVLGLVVAIPLLLCHNVVSAFSRSLVQLLDEQSAGLLARHLEQQRESGDN
ncbi:MAG TPA: MotA/TolQ/ExbB proton channel family protein [Pseudomonadales bacterium]